MSLRMRRLHCRSIDSLPRGTLDASRAQYQDSIWPGNYVYYTDGLAFYFKGSSSDPEVELGRHDTGNGCLIWAG